MSLKSESKTPFKLSTASHSCYIRDQCACISFLFICCLNSVCLPCWLIISCSSDAAFMLYWVLCKQGCLRKALHVIGRLSRIYEQFPPMWHHKFSKCDNTRGKQNGQSTKWRCPNIQHKRITVIWSLMYTVHCRTIQMETSEKRNGRRIYSMYYSKLRILTDNSASQVLTL